MAFFLHYDDPTFEQFGGIYLPYSTQEEAERQAASDLSRVGYDAKALGLRGIFEAEYGGHHRVSGQGPLSVYDYNQPYGHLATDERRKVLPPSGVAKLAKRHVRALIKEQQVAQEDEILALHKAINEGTFFENAVPGNAYSVMTGGTATGGAAALAAATAKTLVMLTAAAANQPAVVEVGISFDGVTATAVPVLVELVSGTAATTGTVVAQTPKQLRGWPGQGAQTTGQITITAEPTVQLVNRKWFVTPNAGLFVVQFPLGREPTGIITAATDAKTWSIRATSPAIVNAHAYMEFEE